MAAADTVPATPEVARWLSVDPDQLEMFVANHADPSVGAVIAAGSVPRRRVPDARLERIAAWIEARKEAQRPGPRWAVRRALEAAPAPRPEPVVVEELSREESRWAADEIREAVAVLVAEGAVERFARPDGPPRLRLSA